MKIARLNRIFPLRRELYLNLLNFWLVQKIYEANSILSHDGSVRAIRPFSFFFSTCHSKNARCINVPVRSEFNSCLFYFCLNTITTNTTKSSQPIISNITVRLTYSKKLCHNDHVKFKICIQATQLLSPADSLICQILTLKYC